MVLYSFTGEASIAASILWTLNRPIASLLEASIEDTQKCQCNHRLAMQLSVVDNTEGFD